MTLTISKTSFLRYLKGTDLYKSFVMALAAVIPVMLAVYTNNMAFGFGSVLGVLLTAPNDVQGNLKHRFNGMLLAIVLIMFTTLVLSLTKGFLVLNLLLFFIASMAISMLSVYGFRASLVALSGLLALVLSYANLGDASVYAHVLYMGIGGIWYMLISTFFIWLRPTKQLELDLGETAKLTADFLELRADLLRYKNERADLQKKQTDLHTKINDLHESLREHLLSSRKRSGSSNYTRRRLLIFIDLVDILELAIAHPVNFKKVDALTNYNPQIIKEYVKLVLAMSKELNHISEVFIDGKKLQTSKLAIDSINTIEEFIAESYQQQNLSQSTLLLLKNVLDFEKKQRQKIQSIEHVLNNIKLGDYVGFRAKEIKKFITPTTYSPKILWENLSFKSNIFRHALRITVLLLLGFFIGTFFQLPNTYWILLTIVVIMRPSYGLTKQRTFKRILGTLIGGTVAVSIILLVQNNNVYAVLGIISLILAFSMFQKNYVGAAAFITINVVMIYALLRPNAFDVIQYRVLDTVLGAGLAFGGSFFLWPNWEYKEMNKSVIASLEANLDYFQGITEFYISKNEDSAKLKLKRKEAFLAMGNLNAAFQRMAQEPKSKQKSYNRLYQYTSYNHTFLASLASLGTFIRTHPTGGASVYFKAYAETIKGNLKRSINNLQNKDKKIPEPQLEIKEIKQYINQEKRRLDTLRFEELQLGKNQISDSLENSMQEVQLITEQLQWLYKVSLNLKKIK